MDDSNRGRLLGGRYQLDRQIATGSMATVYQATDTRLGRPVAVKVLHPVLLGDPRLVARFVQEPRATAQLFHPNLVRVLDVGQDDAGVPYTVMELVRGQNLGEILASRRPLPFEQGLHIAEDVARGLAYAHDRGLVHRDVKPKNILVTPEGQAKLGDFGLAQSVGTKTATRPGELIGTTYYIPPEVSRGEPSTVRSDLYSLGVVLYQIFTGRVPFDGANSGDVVMKHQIVEPISPRQFNPALPAWLERVILRLLRKDPVQRYASAHELLMALEAGASAPVPPQDPRVALANAQTQRLPHVPRTPDRAQLKPLTVPGMVQPGPRTGAQRAADPAARTMRLSRPSQVRLGPAIPARRRGSPGRMILWVAAVALVAVVAAFLFLGYSRQTTTGRQPALPSPVPIRPLATATLVSELVATAQPIATPQPALTATPPVPELLNQVTGLRTLIQGGLSNGQLQPPGQEILSKLDDLEMQIHRDNWPEALKRVDEVGQRIDSLEPEGKITPAFAGQVRQRLQSLRQLLSQ